MLCRFTLIPDGTVLIYQGRSGDTYEDALLSFEINPDTALIFSDGRSLPQDKKIEEEEVSIFLTASRG
ncbi:thiamine S protein [Methanoculleus sp. 7T]|jgi:sulfur carrier protein ThiS|uniref:thiamine S protein n=1 Tax=Methanoculleus sp. 7T TaxID=2937282 RepID=UPI0020BFE1C8|nr:thiamine S protein [Methanoculleus sp. 7T]MCK8518320.1 thiamine S protein [Methanoculleus sp. 7T]